MNLDDIAARLCAAYGSGPGVNHAGDAALPDRESMARATRLVLSLLFPGYFTAEAPTRDQLDAWLLAQLAELQRLLEDGVTRSLRAAARGDGRHEPAQAAAQAHTLVAELLDELPDLRQLVATDVEAAFENDPAAADRAVVVLSYPSIEALAVQRFAHRLYRRQVPLLPRMMTELAHTRTGIDIHPGAQIGESCFIDHGTGVVIGETSRLGRHCVLYQGVGLVAWNPLARGDDGELVRGASNKRHPDLGDHVTIYAGATILGGDTVIGHHSVIGGNVWVTQSVEPWSVVRNNDPQLVIRQRKQRG
jgi:serine O-acetyltransferase